MLQIKYTGDRGVMEFGAALRRYIEKNGLSVSELSRKSGVTRTLIYAIMNGERRLVPENSGRLISPRCFPAEDIEPLYQCWLENELTDEEIAVYRVLLRGLRGEIADGVCGADLRYSPDAVVPENTVLRGRDSVLGAIAAAVNAGTKSLISNFAFDDAVSPLIRRAIAENRVGSVLHTVCFDGSEPARKLRDMFAALAFAEIGIKTKIDDRTGGAWDSYLLTDRHFIQYNNDFSQALVLPAADAPDGLAERYGSSKDFTVKYDGVFDSVIMNEMEQPTAGPRDLFAVTDVISECFVSKKGILCSLSPAVPEKEKKIIVQGLKNHFEIILGPDFYKQKMTNTLRCAIPDTAIADFVDRGRIKDAPAWFFPNVPCDVRAEMLAPFIKRANASVSVIDTKRFGRLRTNIEGNSKNLTLVGVLGGDIEAPNAFKDIRVTYGDSILSGMVMKVFDCFIHSHFCMEKNESSAFIEQQLIKLDALSVE
ncbi:MAG: helix-turn-helix transcriptional regulator [Clostridia bacterium]|nr:helix-turn-helix transcriptional regulator [Clostridia bacterium]